MLLPRTFFAAVVVALFALAPASARAQSVTVFASGLEAPTKVVATGKGNLLVAEGGHGPNTGRISIVDPTGVRRTLVDGLPSAFNLTAEGSPSGPSGIAIRGNTVYVSIAYGDVVDIQAEMAKLRKEKDRLERDLASKQTRLADEAFRSRAPAEVVRQMEATLSERRVEYDKLVQRLAQLEKSAGASAST